MGEFWKLVFISFITSSIGPCISIDPRSASLLELLLTLNGLLCRLFQLLHVLSDNLELLLNALKLILGKLSALKRSPELILLDSELPSELVKLLLVVRGHLGGLPQVFVVLLNGHLVVHALALEHLGLLEDAVGLLRLVGQSGDGVSQSLLGLLGLLLHEHDPPGQGRDVSLHLLVHLLLLLQ